jgi:hypothetical protein
MGRSLRDRRPTRTAPRSKLFTVTPIVLAVLVAVGLVSVIVAKGEWGQSAPVSLSAGNPSSSAPPAGSAGASSSAPAPVNVQAAVNAVDAQQSSTVRLGAAVFDTTSNKLYLGQNGSTQFYCASVLKLFLITALLHDQEQGTVKLSSQDDSYVTRALERSDDNAMDALWEDFSGPQLITEMIQLGHLQDTKLPSDLSQWGETLISPRDVIAVYQYVLHGLSASDRDLVLGDLANAADTGADGFDQAFGLLHDPRVSGVRGKQGWMCYQNFEMLHTTGTLGSDEHYLVAILSRQPQVGDCAPTDSGWSAGRDKVTAATQALIKQLGPTAVG